MHAASIRDTPISVIDFETTGLSFSGGARVVEVAVVRVEPGHEPRVVLDSLIDPNGPVLCTSIHGISDEDVLGAPSFTELLAEIVLSLRGSIVCAFNASFDISFFAGESKLDRLTKNLRIPPHLCLMWLRPLLKLSKRCTLDAACEQHGIQAGTHRAAEDALACAYMWEHYLEAAEKANCRTWGDLARLGTHKYLSSLSSEAYSDADFSIAGGKPSGTAKKPRFSPIRHPCISMRPDEKTDQLSVSRIYWRALTEAFSDDQIDTGEMESLMALQKRLNISSPTLRDAHARLFSDYLKLYAEDGAITNTEVEKLRNTRAALQALGWAPGW